MMMLANQAPTCAKTGSVIDFNVPIFMYHEVTTEDRVPTVSRRTQHSFIVTEQDFNLQMKFLRDNAIQTITLDDLIQAINAQDGSRIPQNSVVITFDDGFSGNFMYAFPMLMTYGLKATFFVIVDKVDSKYMMNWNQLREMSRDGMSIQSHTMSHPLLGQQPHDKVKYELEKSKYEIEQQLGSVVSFISLPMGSYNGSYERTALEVGYRGGCTSQVGFANRKSSSFFLPRIVINGKYDLSRFSEIIDHKSKMVKPLARRQKLKGMVRHIVGERLYNSIYNRVYSIEI